MRQLPAGTDDITDTAASRYDIVPAGITLEADRIVPARVPDGGVIAVYQR